MCVDEHTTQHDVDDRPITPLREGFLAYMFGKFLHENPYEAYGDDETDDIRYYEWFDGWQAALVKYPDIMPKEEN